MDTLYFPSIFSKRVGDLNDILTGVRPNKQNTSKFVHYLCIPWLPVYQPSTTHGCQSIRYTLVKLPHMSHCGEFPTVKSQWLTPLHKMQGTFAMLKSVKTHSLLISRVFVAQCVPYPFQTVSFLNSATTFWAILMLLTDRPTNYGKTNLLDGGNRFMAAAVSARISLYRAYS